MNARQILFIISLILFSSISVFSAWTEPVPVSEVNTDYEEWGPFLSFDGLTLYFARIRTSEFYYGRIFEAIRDRPFGSFTTVREVLGTLNFQSNAHVLSPWISPDNLRMYYYTQETGIGWKLRVSERLTTSDPWPEGTEISELNALGRYLSSPNLTADELIIFFQANNMTGGAGNSDIWMASRSGRNQPFENVRNLSEINTVFIEACPNISPDGLTLHFTSTRNGNDQMYQIFKVTRSSIDMTFSNIEHLSFLDKENECSSFPFVTSDAKTIYFVRHLPANQSTYDIYVSYWVDNVYYVDVNSGDDQNNGTSSQTAFATIQKAIDTAPDGYTIFVKPGIYTGNIDFKGKAITLQGVAGPDGVPVLDSANGYAVAFYNYEGPGSVLKNFVIRNSSIAIFLAGSSPTISNLTIVDNDYGIMAYAGANPDISNCIFWNNLNDDISGCLSRYSLTYKAGQGNIDNEPLFADANNGDYHLKSKRGRFWPEHDIWVLDTVTSPGVDGGDPLAGVSMEPAPNGRIINMGAYGGTAYASLSEKYQLEADYNKDGIIDESDISDLIEEWLAVSGWLE